MKSFITTFFLTVVGVVVVGQVITFFKPGPYELQYRQMQAQQRMPQQPYQLAAAQPNPQFEDSEGPQNSQELELDPDKVMYAINSLTMRVNSLEAQVQALSVLPPSEQSDY